MTDNRHPSRLGQASIIKRTSSTTNAIEGRIEAEQLVDLPGAEFLIPLTLL